MTFDNDPHSEYSTCVRCGKFSDTYRCNICEQIGKCLECEKKDKALSEAIRVLSYLNQNLVVKKLEEYLK